MTYTTNDYRIIRDNLNLPDKQIADLIGRSQGCVSVFRSKNKLLKNKKWCEDHKQFLRDNTHLTDKIIAEKLGRNRSAVAEMRNKLGIKKYKL